MAQALSVGPSDSVSTPCRAANLQFDLRSSPRDMNLSGPVLLCRQYKGGTYRGVVKKSNVLLHFVSQRERKRRSLTSVSQSARLVLARVPSIAVMTKRRVDASPVLKRKKRRKVVREAHLPATPPPAASPVRRNEMRPGESVPTSRERGEGASAHEQRLSRHFFILSDELSALRRDHESLRAEVAMLKEQRVDEEGPNVGRQGDLELKMMTGFKPLADIVDAWMLRTRVEGIFPATDKSHSPKFKTRLPYHYALPVLTTDSEVERPLREEIFRSLCLKESGKTNEVFSLLFNKRKTASKKQRSDDIQVEGFAQRYMRFRRQVKNDKIGKPVLQFTKSKGMKPMKEPWDWRKPCQEDGEVPCRFFKSDDCRQLFSDIFPTSLPGVPQKRTVLSVIQLAILDNTVHTKSLGTDSSQSMAATAKGSLDRVADVASQIAKEIWEAIHVGEGMGNEDLPQPCDCCWVVDISPIVRPTGGMQGVVGSLNEREDGIEPVGGSEPESDGEREIEKTKSDKDGEDPTKNRRKNATSAASKSASMTVKESVPGSASRNTDKCDAQKSVEDDDEEDSGEDSGEDSEEEEDSEEDAQGVGENDVESGANNGTGKSGSSSESDSSCPEGSNQAKETPAAKKDGAKNTRKQRNPSSSKDVKKKRQYPSNLSSPEAKRSTRQSQMV